MGAVQPEPWLRALITTTTTTTNNNNNNNNYPHGHSPPQNVICSSYTQEAISSTPHFMQPEGFTKSPLQDPLLESVMTQINSAQALQTNFLKIGFNFIIPYTFRSSK
jgi:hypothetical protein